MSLTAFHKFFIMTVLALCAFLMVWFGGWWPGAASPHWGWFVCSGVTGVGSMAYLKWLNDRSRTGS